MKSSTISESGLIGQDGRMRLPMERLNQFFADHKGERIIIKIEAAKQGSTSAQIAYYYSYILPTVQQALKEMGERKTLKQTDGWLIDMYPGEKDERILGFGDDVKEARQMDRQQMFDFLEWLKEFAAENLYVYIEDPKTI